MSKRNKLGDRQQGCIEPVIGGKVYDYYNGVLGPEEVRGFERHLVRCHHCEKVILELDHALAVLSDERDFHSIVKNSEQLKDTRPPPSSRRYHN